MADKTAADKAQEQFEAKKTFESEQKAAVLAGQEARKDAIADEKDKGLVHGMPREEWDKLDAKQQRRLEANDPNSDLRNQTTTEDVVDFQLLNNTPAETISAMTGRTLSQLKQRAEELGTTLKGSLAGDLSNK